MKEPFESTHPGNGGIEQAGFTEDLSRIPARLINAYRSAHYRAGFGADAILLRIDHYSEPLSRLFEISGSWCATFITACNPLGVHQSPQKNRAACERLRKRLNSYIPGQDDVIEGLGLDPSGEWPGEESFLVLGLDLEVSRALGDEFQQNAILWASANAIPRLILLH
jgi:hypothetical protein